MRLVGVEFWNAGGPVEAAYLDLAAPAVIAGPNDSGKTRSLETVATRLANLRGEVASPNSRCTRVYMEVDALPPPLDCEWFTFSDPPHACRPSKEELTEVGQRLTSDTDERVPWTLAIGSGTVCRNGRQTEGLLAELCIAERDLERPVLAELARQLTSYVSPSRPPLGLAVIGEWAHELPIVERVDDLLERDLDRVDEAVTRLTAALRLCVEELAADEELWLEASQALTDTWSDASELRLEGIRGAGPRRALVRENEQGAHLHSDARVAADYFGWAVTSKLPDFVADSYCATVELPSVADLIAGSPAALVMSHVERPETRYPAGAIAGGFRTWLSLAVAQALQSSRAIATAVEKLTEAIVVSWDRLCDMEDDVNLEEQVIDEQRAALHRLLGLLGILQRHVRSPEAPTEASDPAIEDIDAVRAHTPHRIYLVDEPEQRLHPRLQRAAARWLGQFAEAENAALILATHSLAFITDIPGARVHEITRGDGSGAIVRRRMAPLAATDLLAVELGVERGELLAGIRLFLFVEGIADLRVLEAIYSHRLREAGAFVMAAHGHRKLADVLQMEFLLTHLATPIAFMLDRLQQRDIELMRINASHRIEALKDRKNERHTAASIVAAEERAGRRVEILGIEVDGIFDALDERAVRQVFPRYPGHQAAQHAFATSGNVQNAARRKKFYEERWDVSHAPGTQAKVARVMRDQHLDSKQLEKVMSRIEELAHESTQRHQDLRGY